MSRNKPLEQYLSEMIRIPTVSFTPERYHIAEYRDYLKREFPHLFAAMKLRMFDESMLLEWEGTDPSLRPIVITGHMDVVDADPSEWKHPPFGGEIHDGEIWGRGALDMKDSQCALSYALDECCEAGFRPQRNVLHRAEAAAQLDPAVEGRHDLADQRQMGSLALEGSSQVDQVQPFRAGCTPLLRQLNRVAEDGHVVAFALA